MRKTITAIILTLLLLPCISLADTAGRIDESEKLDALEVIKEYPIAIEVDGERLSEEELTTSAGDKACPPLILRGRTLIPSRSVFEHLGAEVSWNAESEGVEISLGDKRIMLTVDSDIAKANGEEKKLDVPAVIIDHDGDGFGSTMIPFRFVGEALGYSVDWDNDERIVKLGTRANEAKEGEDTQGEGPDSSANTAKTGEDTQGEDVKDEPSEKDDESGEKSGGGDVTIKENETAGEKAVGVQKTPYGEIPALKASAQDKLIYLDPGHGGKDSGAIGHAKKADQIYEKDVNLAAALKARDYLTATGAKVYMMRETDIYKYQVAERGFEANEVGAELYISIHNNSAEVSGQNGTEVHFNDKYVYSDAFYEEQERAWKEWNDGGQKGDPDYELRDEIAEREKEDGTAKTLKEVYGFSSSELARAVQKQMVATIGLKDRGYKSSPQYGVLNKSMMPAIIIEGAFLSNEGDFAVIKSADYADKYGFAVAKAVVEFLNEH